MIDYPPSSRTPRPLLAAPLALLGLLLLALPSVSRGADPSFGEIVDVRVVNLEIVVTDDKERVVALEADDFHLLVDGVETPIEYFSEVRHGWAVPAVGNESTMPSLPSDVVVGTRYLIFVDDFFTLPSHRNQVLRAFEQQLPMLAPDDHVAIVAFDGRRVEMLSTWTRSQREIERAIDEAMARPSYGLQRRIEQKVFESSFLRDRAGRFGAARASYVSNSAEEIHRSRELARQVELVVNGATSALRGFARPDGRKVMLLLSGGWPSSSAEWLFGSFEAAVRYGALGETRHLFDPLIDTANLLGYTLYPIDVAHTVRNAGVNAEYGALAEANLASNLAVERDFVEESALTMVAAATGGRAFLDGASRSALEQSISDTRSYYSIGFAPTWTEDDRRHRIEVRLRDPRFKVRSRTSFSDLSRQSELTMLVESAQLFDTPLAGEGQLAVTLGRASNGGFSKVVVPVEIEIPLELVTVLPSRDGYSIDLELRVAAAEPDGDRSDIPVIPIRLRGSKAPLAGETATYQAQLRLRKTPQELLISVYDLPSGTVISKRVAFTI